MITHNADYTTNATAPVKSTRVILTEVVASGTPVVFTNEDDLMSVKLDSIGSFLGTATKKITVKALGIHAEFAGLTFTLELGIHNPTDDTWDDITLGTFTTDNVALDYEAESTTVVMYDAMYRAVTTRYDSNGFVYPCTVEELAGYVCDRLGIDLMDDFDLLPNADYEIVEDLYALIEGTTLRDIINEIAQTTATTAIIDSTGKLKFVEFADSGEVMTSDNLKKLTIDKYYGKINSVVLSRQPQNDDIALTNNDVVNSYDGKNMLNLLTVTEGVLDDGVLAHEDDTSVMTIDGNSVTFQVTTTLRGIVSDFIIAEASTDYVISWAQTQATTHGYIDYYDVDKEWLSRVAVDIDDTFETPADTAFLRVSYEAETISIDYGLSSIQLEIGTVPTTYEDYIKIGVKEFKIINNEIMDDDRTTLIEPIADALMGIGFDGVKKVETEGHGWYEVGDVVSITQDGNTYSPFITEIHLVLEGSIRETFVCTPPDPTRTNQQMVGGIAKTLFNTEIKVDKQGQEITSVVSQMTTLNDTVASNYTEINQNIDNITSTIQTTGGNNLIQNSVGYATDTTGAISFWTPDGDDLPTANTSPESIGYGAVSGNQINLTGTSTMTQRVAVQAGAMYSLAFRAKKAATGSAVIHLTNTTDDYTIELEDSTAYLWNEQSVVGVVPTVAYFDVVIETTEPDGFAITDLRLVTGDIIQQWTQAVGEILNTQVTINTEGIRVNSNVYAGDFTQMTPLEFAGYSSVSGAQERIFGLDRDRTYSKKLEVETQITMPPIKVVPITSGSRAGWAFVKVDN